MAKDLKTTPGRAAAQGDRKPPRAKLTSPDDKTLNVGLSGDWQRLLRATAHETVSDGLVSHIVSVGETGKTTNKTIQEAATNFALGFVDAMMPEDAAEALLLAQMAVTHQIMMTMAGRPSAPRRDNPATGLRRTRLQQGGADLCGADGHAETVSLARATGGAGGTRHGERRRAGDCRHCRGRGAGVVRKCDGNPMQSAHDAPRCLATSKRSGQPCRAPAVRGWAVCRMHGAGGGARSGPENPNWQHGGRSADSVEMRKMVNALGREARKLADLMGRV
jgi:hypothetical protein